MIVRAMGCDNLHFKLHPVFLFQVTQRSGAHVRVVSDSGEPGCKTTVSFLLQGSEEQVLLARCILENLVIDSEPVSEALEVPQTAFGRIIGRFQHVVDDHEHESATL